MPLRSPWHGIVQWEKSIAPAVNTMCLCAFLKALPSWSLVVRNLALNRFQCQYVLLPTNVKKWPQRVGSDAVSGCWQSSFLLASHTTGNVFRKWEAWDEKDTISSSFLKFSHYHQVIYIYIYIHTHDGEKLDIHSKCVHWPRSWVSILLSDCNDRLRAAYDSFHIL